MADSREMRAGMIEAEIDRFIVEGQYSLAVILRPATLELLGSFTLNRRTQRFFEHALDLRFNEEMPDELHAYLDHNRLRNRIVHEGANAGHEAGVASLAAVRGIPSRLHQIVLRRTGSEE